MDTISLSSMQPPLADNNKLTIHPAKRPNSVLLRIFRVANCPRGVTGTTGSVSILPGHVIPESWAFDNGRQLGSWPEIRHDKLGGQGWRVGTSSELWCEIILDRWEGQDATWCLLDDCPLRTRADVEVDTLPCSLLGSCKDKFRRIRRDPGGRIRNVVPLVHVPALLRPSRSRASARAPAERHRGGRGGGLCLAGEQQSPTQRGGIELFRCVVGSDGHIAFNERAMSLRSSRVAMRLFRRPPLQQPLLR
nr:hypothetical protein CFP56_10390 [Quercus suber]